MIDSQKYNKLSSKITPKRNKFNLRHLKKKKKWTLISGIHAGIQANRRADRVFYFIWFRVQLRTLLNSFYPVSSIAKSSFVACVHSFLAI